MEKLSIGNINDYTENFEELLPLAENDNALAQFLIGWMYENGKGTLQDYKLAEEWYLKAAKQKFIEANLTLGNLYEEKKDYINAKKFYMKATKNRFKAKAYYKLGLIYEKKSDPNEDSLKTAMKWYYKSANQGYTEAQCRLGKIYQEIGKKIEYASSGNFVGFHRLYSMAKKCYEATEKKSAEALYQIGIMYMQGMIPNSRSYETAHFYFRKSAELGVVEAQNILGMFYAPSNFRNDIFNIHETTFSHMWYIIAKINGSNKIHDALINEHDELLKAKVMAKRCIESNYKECSDGGHYQRKNLKKLMGFKEIFELLEHYQISIKDLITSLDE